MIFFFVDPPGPPEISGYTNGQAIRAGDTLKLVCVSKGGNPLAQVIWFKNDQEVDFSYTGGNNKAVNELAFTVQASDNDAVYKCEASNVIPSPRPLTASYKLIVHCKYMVVSRSVTVWLTPTSY